MKVVLLAKVPGLGDMDDIKDVADGYAVNFLFPRNLAVIASPKALEKIEKQKQKKKRDEEKDLREQQSLAGKLRVSGDAAEDPFRLLVSRDDFQGQA